MADTSVPSPAPRKRRGWLRILGITVGVLLVLLIVAYFVGTSSAFVKAVILPKVGASLNAQITVSDASISPFSQVVLRDLKVRTTGNEPLVSAPLVRLRYSLFKIMGGTILVQEVSLESPTVTLVENPDGSSNLDPILKSQEEQEPSEPEKPSEPLKIDIQKISLSKGTIRQLKLYEGGKQDLLELDNLNVELTGLKNGAVSKLTVASDLKMDNNPPSTAERALFQGKMSGSFSLGLTADLKPGTVLGNARLDVTRAEGALAQAAGFSAILDTQVEPTEIKRIALALQRGDSRLGQVLVSGPFNMEKTEGRLTVQLNDVDKNLLNLAGSGSGMDFGPTTINSSNLVTLASGGESVTVAGQFNINKLQVTRTNQTTPVLDLGAVYDITMDQAKSNIAVRTFNLAGTQQGSQFLEGKLTSPMLISMDPRVTNAVGDSALSVNITRFDLANWKAFLGDYAPAGQVNLKSQLVSKQGGAQLSFDLDAQVSELTVVSGSNNVAGINVSMQARGQAAEMQQFNFPQYRLQVAHQNQPVMTISGSGLYDLRNETADVRTEGEVVLPRLLEMMPQPDAKFSSGSIQLRARLVQKKELQDVTGSFALSDLTGNFGSNIFRQFGTTAEFEVGMNPRQVQIRKASGQVTETGKPGGKFDVTGTYDLTNETTQINARLADFNQNGLRTFLEPTLMDKKLVSVALNGSTKLQYDPKGASVIQTDLQITNLVVNDPKGQLPSKALEARLQLEASLDKQIAEVKQFALGLTPTERATNRVQLTGRLDMTDSTNMQGNFKLSADSLDFTSYYDLFMGGTTPSQTQAAAVPQSTQPAPASGPETEPEPMRLPFTNFTAEATVGRLFLHEVAISNLVTLVKINAGQVQLDPFKMNLNGAPVNTAVHLDLGVKGYKYDILANAQGIPLAPLVNSFQPERRGQVGGTLSADAKIAGIGTTGASLQKHLAGHFDVGSTNLNLSVIHIRNPLLRSLVNLVAMIPELARNPETTLTSLVGNLLPKPGVSPTGGLASELEKSPIDQIVLKGSMGGGKVQLQQAFVQSAAFQAQATGSVQLQQILTNSTVQMPVTLALSRSVAERINLLPANTPTNQAFVKLPDFVTMRGTVGEPKTDINKVALAGTLFQGVRGLIPGTSGQTGNIIQGLLGGGTASRTNSPGTTNRPGNTVGGLLQGILGTPTTNAPATSTNKPATTNQTPIGNLLDGLLGPKKK